MIATTETGGLPFPPGDPEAVRGAARALESAARSLGSAMDATAGHVSAALSAWTGPASESFAGAARAVQGGTGAIGDGAVTLGSVLTVYADALEEAQRLARRAHQAMADAEQALAGAMAAADAELQQASATTAGSLGRAAARMAADARASQAAASSQFSAASASATAMADQAMQLAAEAASLAARRVRSVIDGIRSMSLHDWGTAIGGLGVAFEGVSATTLGLALNRLFETRAVLASGNWDRIAELNPKAWEQVAKFADSNGEESLATLAKAYEYETETGQEATQGVVNALGGFGRIPTDEGALATGLDVVGKVGLGVGVVGDVYTLAEGQLPDKIVAGANLAGIGGAAAGTELGGTVAGLLGAESVAAWIPVAGQALIGATALAAAGLWVYENRAAIGHFASEAGSDALHAVEWVNQEESRLGADALGAGEHVVGAAVDEAGSLASTAVGTAEHVGASIAKAGAGLVSGAAHTAENVLSDLNPF